MAITTNQYHWVVSGLVVLVLVIALFTSGTMSDLGNPLNQAILVWVLSICVATLLGAYKSRVLSGLVWSLLLGPVGVLIVLLQKDLDRNKGESVVQETEETERSVQPYFAPSGTIIGGRAGNESTERIPSDERRSQDIDTIEWVARRKSRCGGVADEEFPAPD